MTPEQQIGSLDRMLRTRGEDIVLIRGRGAGAIRVTCRAKVSGYAPEELVGDVTQQDSRVIMSPSQIAGAGWPGADEGPSTPQSGDRALIQGFEKVVQAATAIQAGGRTVRIEMRVRGEAS